MRSRPLIKRPTASITTSNTSSSSSSSSSQQQQQQQQRHGLDTVVLPETIHQQQNHHYNNNINNGSNTNNNRKRIRRGNRSFFSISNNGQLLVAGPIQIPVINFVVIVCSVIIIMTVLMMAISLKGTYNEQQQQQQDHPISGSHRRNTIKDVIIGRLKPTSHKQRNLPLTNDNSYHTNQNRSNIIISPLTKGFDIILSTTMLSSTTKEGTTTNSKHNGNNFPNLEPFGRHRRRAQKRRDYGNLIIRFHEELDRRLARREVIHDFLYDHGYDDLSAERQDDDDHHDYYYAFDDDYIRNPYTGWSDDKIQDTKSCRRTNWHRELPIDCNRIHEFDLESKVTTGLLKYLGGGSYRQVYTSQIPEDGSDTSQVVFKTFYYDAKFNYEDFEFMRMDAIVAEKFASNPRIVNIYGYCALGMINEIMDHGDLEKVAVPRQGRIGHKLPIGKESEPRNTLPPLTKLKYSLDMVEAVVLLHGYHGGVIVHDDIQLSQFLLDSNGNLQLNDFNRAEIMFWNDKDKEYCKYRNNPGHGDWRAPQEYLDVPLDEKIDIWSLGNNMYSLLTGLYPLYEIKDTNEYQKLLKQKKTGVVDPGWFKKSIPERKLAEIIPLCWEYDPDKRIDIFHLAELLRAAYNESLAAVVPIITNTTTGTQQHR